MSTAITQKLWAPSVVKVGDHIEGTCVTSGCTYDGIVTEVHGPIRMPDCGGYRYTIRTNFHGTKILFAQWILTPLVQAPDAPHFTFDEAAARWEQGNAPQRDITPCVCWHAGYGEAVTGLRREQVQHPKEYDEGARTAFEKAYDL